MDDARIDLIAREVLTSLKKARAHEAPAPAPGKVEPDASGVIHPSLRLLTVTGGVVGSPCVIEPDKVCVGSLKCRTFGH
jgi:hypothetical protein